MEPTPQFRATHTAPAGGMATWPEPGAATSGPRLDPYLPVQLLTTNGAWAHVACSNGWSAWVDGRLLVPIPAPVPATAGPPAVGATPPPVTAAPLSGAAPVPPLAGYATAIPPAAGRAAGQAAAPAGRYQFVVPSKATWPTCAGAALLVVATFLPWVDPGRGAKSSNSFDVPVTFLFDKTKAGDKGLSIGVVLLVLAAASFALRHVTGLESVSRIPAGLTVPIVVMFVVQLNSLASDAKLSLMDVLGLGVWPAAIGAALASWGGRSR